jgi:hypothetical protein
MYKVLVHKGDYITYRLGDIILTDRVDVLYKRHKQMDLSNTNIRSIEKYTGNVELRPTTVVNGLTHLYGVEIYDEDNNLLNNGPSKFTKCVISNSDDIIWGKMDIDDEVERIIAYLFGYMYRSAEYVGFSEKGNLIIRFPIQDMSPESIEAVYESAILMFCKCTGSHEIVKTKTKRSGQYQQNFTISMKSSKDSDSFVDWFQTTLLKWFGAKSHETIDHHRCIPFGLLNAKTMIKRAFIDGLADYIDNHYGEEDNKNEMILDLMLEGYGKDFVLSYRLLLETMNITYYSFSETKSFENKERFLASRTFADMFKDVALSDTQIVNLTKGETLTQRCYLLEVDEMIGINGYKYVHK